jgi:hypothetical protein
MTEQHKSHISEYYPGKVVYMILLNIIHLLEGQNGIETCIQESCSAWFNLNAFLGFLTNIDC